MDVMKATDTWCPKAQREGGGNRDHNGQNPGGCNCLASGCAVWRYFKDSKTDGYCGLADKPNG